MTTQCLVLTSDQLAALQNALYDLQDVPELKQVFKQICEIYGETEEEDETE